MQYHIGHIPQNVIAHLKIDANVVEIYEPALAYIYVKRIQIRFAQAVIVRGVIQ